MTECNITKNKQDCTCTYNSCPRKGLCCECITYHKDKGQLPGCLFPEDVEAAYDRSIACFAETYKERGEWW